MAYSLGLDIGSVNVKLCLIDEADRVVKFDIEKITSNARSAVNALLGRLDDLSQITAAGVSGSGKSVIPKKLNWGEYSSSLAIASGLLNIHPETKTIIQIGGQSSFVIGLEDGLTKPWKVASNPLCAAGTGRFVEQQAYRLGISMDDFARLALECQDKPPRIAARCSVFAKSDLIHLQQKGVSISAMLYALCESIARMVVSLQKGVFEEPVYFVGGVAANEAVAKALSEAVSARNGQPVTVNVPENKRNIEALGAALLSKGRNSIVSLLPEEDSVKSYFEMDKLEQTPVPESPSGLAIKQPCSGYLGIDVGSTSTKAVILDESGKEVIAKNYLMTAGRPIEAVKQVFQNLLADGAANVKVSGVGVTGSGRYLVGGFIGADLIKNEITAQTRAAAEIDPDADIIEIGGQDSKLVIKRNGVVIDYQMNKACAAGTGSFIDELAEMLGVRVTNGDFARLAFNAPHTIDLGTRCAAFMGQSVASAQQEGVSLEVITASLSHSIAKNYLSKVLGNRKLGERVVLTGAVFHNDAIVAAFREQLKEKTLVVSEHREVSGAIGAALLVREASEGQKSKFKGFQKLIDSECKLTTFVCKGCDNNCTITQMRLEGEKPTFYGSRCDRYDSALTQEKRETFFDQREKLLLKEYKEGAGTGPVVGIPRALLVYDFAPLLIGFLNDLDARVVVSSKTTKEIMERSVELAYTDSCFPMKLVHGHVEALKDKSDYILYPCAIRLGPKNGDASQQYACPLIQASPFIVRTVLGMGDNFLSPLLDLSLGEDEVVKNLTEVATKMGFSRRKGKKAGLAGIAAQHRFEAERAKVGARLLKQLKESNQLGVVLMARSYMSQDSGANLGIAEKLAQLGVVPIPLDFLPLNTVKPQEFSDRPYWAYEGKYIAAAKIIAQDPQLYGLALTNFGCGPNSFILKLVEDIMSGKPMGQLEIDEHAAEAGLVTRLEAFVDTIEGYAPTAEAQEVAAEEIRRYAPPIVSNQKTLVLPNMAPFVEVLGQIMESCGGRTIVLPPPDERSLFYSNQVSSGTECLPYRVTLGDFLKFFYEHPERSKDVELAMVSAYGPCRLGKYALEQITVLKKAGFNVPMLTTISNNAYRDMDFGPDFQRLAIGGIFAADCLNRLLWRTRPYEKEPGLAENLFDEHLQKVKDSVHARDGYAGVLEKATAAFKSAIDPNLPRRPLVGINGEIYLRSNRFSNNNLVKVCEAAGLEVTVSSVGEWLKYISYRHFEDSVHFRKARNLLSSYIKNSVVDKSEHRLLKNLKPLTDEPEPSIKELLSRSSLYLSPRCGSEAVLSIGSGVEWLENPRFAGVISVMPHGCMPGGIVAAMSEKLSQIYHKPWISLTYDGILETNNLTRINNFAEIIRFCTQ
ncbi:MAG: acyl-CoA dehydratase activase [Dehalococcoidia bacterium]|jgi:predicted CoA-substrate-specific enzyme activase